MSPLLIILIILVLCGFGGGVYGGPYGNYGFGLGGILLLVVLVLLLMGRL